MLVFFKARSLRSLTFRNFFVFREVHQFETYRLMIASGGATPAKPPILLVLVFPTVFVLMFVFTFAFAFAFAFALAFAFAGVLLFVFIVGKFCGGATGL